VSALSAHYKLGERIESGVEDPTQLTTGLLGLRMEPCLTGCPPYFQLNEFQLNQGGDHRATWAQQG
jgi:hypothetical protein